MDLTDVLLLDACRALGLPCKGRVNGRVVTWTTDADAANAAREAGAYVIAARGIFDGAVTGYEVSFAPDTYALTAADRAG